ncbi:hypothetical protein JW756_06430 [Candidatus Woesearchaeota archaeon]|nr:hypothetical protein [Candidatus Woesearchaeota archaeon]
MLYIHQLKDLTPKSADIEAVPLIREIKTRTPLPLREEHVRSYFELFFVSESELRSMIKAHELIPQAVQEVQALLHANDHDYEAVNLQRAITMLKEIPPFLLNNINYAREIGVWQSDFVISFTKLFNQLPNIKHQPEEFKKDINDELNNVFEKILRNNDMAFNYKDVVSEGQTSRIGDLSESMEKGFFFHVLLEEEIKKHSFEIIKHRIPGEKVRKVDSIRLKVEEIKKGVDAAYELNMRMINWALVIYGYIKWLTGR